MLPTTLFPYITANTTTVTTNYSKYFRIDTEGYADDDDDDPYCTWARLQQWKIDLWQYACMYGGVYIKIIFVVNGSDFWAPDDFRFVSNL